MSSQGLIRSGLLLAVCVLEFSKILFAQPTALQNKVTDNRHTLYAFTDVTVVVAPGEMLEHATFLVQDGKVKGVGTTLDIPDHAVHIPSSGRYIYPSFIDLHSAYGMPKTPPKKKSSKPQYLRRSNLPLAANDAVHAEFNSAESFSPVSESAKNYRAAGFGSVVTSRHDGIFRGTASWVFTGEGIANSLLKKPLIGQALSFSKGTSQQAYPSSLMGAISLIRQTYYNADWYNQSENRTTHDASLEAIINGPEQVIFEANSALNILRASAVLNEFELNGLYIGGGDEYQHLDALAALEAPVVIPVNFPDVYDVSDPYDALQISLEDLRHWEMAPHNARLLHEKEIPFFFSAHKLKDKKDFLTQLRKTVLAGLGPDKALEALTTGPANWLGVADQIGTLEKGKWANFIILDGPLFQEGNLLSNWVLGKPYKIQERPQDVRGTYALVINGKEHELKVSGKEQKPKAQLSDTTEHISFSREGNLVTLTFRFKQNPPVGEWRLSGKINGASKIWDGRGQDPHGNWFTWSAIRHKDHHEKSSKSADSLVAAKRWFPNRAYGWDSLPEAEDFIIRRATIWTLDSMGTFIGDVRIRDGKIEAVGKDLEYNDSYKVYSGKDMHITPGIVDEHSHIAISNGVNEGSFNSSSMVRIGDVINPTDINIYRHLAGGVTTVQLLHGSANPIGGQSALLKLKWGFDTREMKIKDAPGFIKFALGENVKQSNWGDNNKTRFPQTRMGVEQVYYDQFYRAKAYAEQQQVFRNEQKRITVKKLPIIKGLTGYHNEMPRRDLGLDALVQILDTNRFITCHSYMQHEINMLMHVGDSMGFRVNTFTHILEGYKVADKMKAHGVAASTFSDWWAYKFEVYDAIPYNASLLTQAGVLTGINSDDAEMGRRLNQEAAKSVKYGGLSDEEALKLVTLNPAKILHLDHRIGSISPGKDADFVVWSAHPLSQSAQVQQTYIEGVRYYDVERNAKLTERNNTERMRLVAKLMRAKANGAKVEKKVSKKAKHYHCDTMLENYLEE